MRSKPVEFALALEAACGAWPEQRTMQVIANSFGARLNHFFFIEDDEFILALYEYASKGTGSLQSR